jgi:hypothetical protein
MATRFFHLATRKANGQSGQELALNEIQFYILASRCVEYLIMYILLQLSLLHIGHFMLRLTELHVSVLSDHN